MAEKTCDVSGCNEESVKTVAKKKVEMVFSVEGKNKIHLCKKHYKEYKKQTKKERSLERVGWV